MSIPSEFSDITEEELAGLRARARLRWENERANSRFSLPIVYRLPLATTCSFLTGMGLGMSRGSRKAALQFRAENAHRLPTTPKGWYLYHKSKNYQVGWGGIKEGLKMGSKLSFWVIGYFGIEHALDEFWGKKDFTSSVAASLVVSGGFSWRNKFDMITTVSMAKKGLAFGLAFGLTQDAIGYLRGRPLGYVDWIKGRGRDRELHPDMT